MADLEKIVEELSSLSVLEASELSKLLEEKWGVSAAAPAAAAAAPAAAVASAAAAFAPSKPSKMKSPKKGTSMVIERSEHCKSRRPTVPFADVVSASASAWETDIVHQGEWCYKHTLKA